MCSIQSNNTKLRSSAANLNSKTEKVWSRYRDK